MSDRSDAGGQGRRALRGRVDPRAPRFSSAIAAVLLLVTVFLGLIGLSTARVPSFGAFLVAPADVGYHVTESPWAITYATVGQRILDPAFLLLLLVAILFLWGAAWPRSSPGNVLFRALVAPRLAAPTEWEDARPPRFAQGVGLFVAVTGLLLQLLGVPWALPIAAATAFVASFLNAVFRVCLGCQCYLLLQRAGIVGRARSAAA